MQEVTLSNIWLDLPCRSIGKVNFHLNATNEKVGQPCSPNSVFEFAVMERIIYVDGYISTLKKIM